MTDQRSQARISDAELLMLSWNENGTTFRQFGNVENLSANGAGMIVDDALPLGSTVAMTYGDGELTAVVRHCTVVADGHFIGVKFVGNSLASMLHFQPELLT